MKYTLRGLAIESGFLQPNEFSAECILIPESGDDMAVLSKLMMGCTVHASSTDTLPSIKNVYFNPPATVVLWDDGTKTVVKCQDGDTYSHETGLALCMAKKAMGNNGKFNDIFHKWIPEEKEACAPKKESVVPKGCDTCKFERVLLSEDPCRTCILSYSNWKPAK